MSETPTAELRPGIGGLLRGSDKEMAAWGAETALPLVARHALVILLGGGAFGAAVGSWRAVDQAMWVALKLPFVLLGTATGNALINGMLAPLLGIDLRLRVSFTAVLASFAVMAVILGALSPLVFFLSWNLPPAIAGSPEAKLGQSGMLVALVGSIVVAGVAGNVRLFGWLRRIGGAPAARRLLFAWLAVNLLLGVQVSWILRPFVGAVHLAVAPFMAHPLDGSFIDEIGEAVRQIGQHFHFFSPN
jgi:hypothetical protein